MSLKDAVGIMKKLHNGDLEATNWFLGMSFPRTYSKLTQITEGKLIESHDDGQPVLAAELSGARPGANNGQGSIYPHTIDDLFQPASDQRQNVARSEGVESEMIRRIGTVGIGKFFPILWKEYSRRWKVQFK